MNVIGHYDEFVQEIFLLAAIVVESLDKEFGYPLRLKKFPALPGLSADEVGAEIVDSRGSQT